MTERGLVDSLVSTGAVTTELIVQYVRAMQNSQATNVRTLHRLVGGKVEALEFGVTADVPFAGVPLRDLNLRKISLWRALSAKTARRLSRPATILSAQGTM